MQAVLISQSVSSGRDESPGLVYYSGPPNIYTTSQNNFRFFSPRVAGESMPIYQCKPVYLNWPRAVGRRDREFKNAGRNFFPPPRRRRRCTTTRCTEIGKISLSVWRPPIRPESFVCRVARLFRTGMKINYFVNSCVTLAVRGPSLWATAAQGAIFQFPMSPPPFTNPYFRPVLSFPAALSLHIFSLFFFSFSLSRFWSMFWKSPSSPSFKNCCIFTLTYQYFLNRLSEMIQIIKILL